MNGVRIHDRAIDSALLYQLSYHKDIWVLWDTSDVDLFPTRDERMNDKMYTESSQLGVFIYWLISYGIQSELTTDQLSVGCDDSLVGNAVQRTLTRSIGSCRVRSRLCAATTAPELR